jgi:hypothetical protein
MQPRPLVYADLSGSTSVEMLQRLIQFARITGADIAGFDTEMVLLPYSAALATPELLNTFGRGGTEIRRSMRMLGSFMREAHQKYHVIYVIGDLFMEALHDTDIADIDVNFYFLAMGETREAEEKQAKFYEKLLDATGLERRTKCLSFLQYIDHPKYNSMKGQ